MRVFCNKDDEVVIDIYKCNEEDLEKFKAVGCKFETVTGPHPSWNKVTLKIGNVEICLIT